MHDKLNVISLSGVTNDGVKGQVRIEVRRIRLLRPKSEPLRVEICWYGQRECDSVPVLKNPVSKACAGERAVTYDVVTGKENFIKYLSAAKKLFLKVVAANKDVGYSSIDRLTRSAIQLIG